jgi:methylase of polypeptide subunit release factors
MKHAMVLNLCGGRLHYAPLDNPQSVLDIGTGTGIWAIDCESAINISLNTNGIQLAMNIRAHRFWELT